MHLTDPGTICLCLLAAAAVTLSIGTRVRLARQQRRGSVEDSPSGRAIGSSSMPDELARWEVEMHELARGLSAQLDAKLSLLQSLIAEANRASERLEDVLDRANPALPSEDRAEPPRPIVDAGRDLSDRADSGAMNEPARPTPEPMGEIDRSRRREEIYQLSDYGFAPAEIARRVGSPIGEVALILSLRGK